MGLFNRPDVENLWPCGTSDHCQCITSCSGSSSRGRYSTNSSSGWIFSSGTSSGFSGSGGSSGGCRRRAQRLGKEKSRKARLAAVDT